MGRTINKSNYHYEVYFKNETGDIEKKYYKTNKEISTDFGISRATIYNLKTKGYNSRDTAIVKINKLPEPIPIFILLERPNHEVIKLN